MSILRQGNWLGQQRIDVPYFRALESSTCADFDVLAGRIMAGSSPLISNGFEVVSTGITQASHLQVKTAGATLIHPLASESGSIFQVEANRAIETLNATNTRVSGSFTPSQVNYIGIDLIRSTDESTSDLSMFIDTVSLVDTPKEVPLGRTLDYRIVISTNDFAQTPTLAPLAIVTTDVNNNIASLTDARNTPWRLATGGTIPDKKNAYAWPDGRKEDTSGDPFIGGDKTIKSMKEWADASMSRLWELGGGEYWYSPTADRNVKMTRSGARFASTGEHFEWDGTDLHWQGLGFVFDNSTGTSNTIQDQTSDETGITDLADGECIYVDLDRTQTTTVVAVKTAVATLGTPVVPGSRWVIAWRRGSEIVTRDQGAPVGSSLQVATISAVGTAKLSAADIFPTDPTTVLCSAVGYAAVASGLTRGGDTASDFVGGAGNLQIGGQSNDEAITISTTRSEDGVVIDGLQAQADGRATLEVFNGVNHLIPGDYNVKTLELQDSSGDPAHRFFSNGAMGFRLSTGVVSDDASGGPIACKIYVRKDGTTPTAKDQLVIRFFNTSPPTEVIIAESDNY